MADHPGWIEADWPAPPGVRAGSTTRHGGLSERPFASLNLGAHVGDAPRAVAANRDLLAATLELPSAPAWLTQVHGTAVVDAASVPPGAPPEADASLATRPGVVCAVMTADCLPVLFRDRAGTRVAAAHAGWRGLAAGVLEATVDALGAPGEELVAWLGPAIGPEVFEVGPEVRAAFLAVDPGAEGAFRPSPAGRWLADLYTLARRRLAAVGLTAVYGGGRCTLSEPGDFFSYRREGRTGRMASLVWIDGRGAG